MSILVLTMHPKRCFCYLLNDNLSATLTSGLSVRLGKGAVTDNVFPLDSARAVNKRYVICVSLLSGILKGHSSNFQCCFQC